MLLSVGDVLQTHPHPEYWGCALVLTAREAIGKLEPTCHIGITPLVLAHEFTFAEVDPDTFTILEISSKYRVAPLRYVSARRRPCIGIYSRKLTDKRVRVLGQTSVSALVPKPLSFDAGDGTDGGWPVCGRVEASLGYEAIHAWRAIHDRERWEREVAAGVRSFEDLLERERGARRGRTPR